MSAVYLDYNASGLVRPEVQEIMSNALADNGNPSAVHAAGRRLAPFDGNLEGGNRQAGVDRPADGIADDPARPGVEDDGDVDEAEIVDSKKG